MTNEQQDPTKGAKKQAKAEAKAAKKQAKAEADTAAAAEAARQSPAGPDPDSPAERSARAAERKVALESWRTIFAAVGALVALGTLLFMARQGCA
jgi:hypothetical protein